MCKKQQKKTKPQQRTLKLHIFDYLFLLNLFLLSHSLKTLWHFSFHVHLRQNFSFHWKTE